MWHHFAIHFAVPSLAYGFIGWWFGEALIAIPELQTFKVLNIIGLTFDLLGITILSRFVSSNPRYQSFVSGPIAEHLFGFAVCAHFGILLCSKFGPSGPSKLALENISYGSLIFVLMWMTFFIQIFVNPPEGKLPWSDETRSKLLGGFFLFSGIIIQLFAAVQDLYI